jgi:miniconductance mechanosensitive channel
LIFIPCLLLPGFAGGEYSRTTGDDRGVIVRAMEWAREIAGHPLAIQAIGLCALGLGVLALHFVTRRFLVRWIERFVEGSGTDWDDALHEAQVFDRLVAMVPAVLGWYGVRFLPEVGETLEAVVSRVALATIVLFVGRAVIAFLGAANTIYAKNPDHQDRPIKGYLQVVQIAAGIVVAVLILAILIDRSPVIFLSGLGAMTAVLLLIFRDTILSLVASVQITGHDLVRVGDWIEMPQFGADGDVTDVALHTVKVQNWDKTITTIPTHRLISDPFKNWRFMTLAGGRRIKRALRIEAASVRFLDDEEMERFAQYALLRDYVAEKQRALDEHNGNIPGDPGIDANIRRLTNLGTFRAYVEQYLRTHPNIHHEGMTLMVRQLEGDALGIPIEVYCFTTTTAWTEYEAIQADLFDHFYAIAADFGLRVFQSPSGADVRALARQAEADAS